MPKNIFTDYVSMKSYLLFGMLCFLKHAPVLEIFGSNSGYFNSFHYWVRGGSWLRRLVSTGTSLEERNVSNRLSLGGATSTDNLKIFG